MPELCICQWTYASRPARCYEYAICFCASNSDAALEPARVKTPAWLTTLCPLKLLAVLELCEVRGPVGLFATVAVLLVSFLAPAGAAGAVGHSIP